MNHLSPPDPRAATWIVETLRGFGVYVDEDTAMVVAGATFAWIENTIAGKEELIRRMRFEWQRGKSDHTYQRLDTCERIKPDDLYELKATVIKGEFVPPGNIDIEEAGKEGCDDCGILAHCTREIRSKHDGTYMKICNHCLATSEDSLRRDQAGNEQCLQCTVLLCDYNQNPEGLRARVISR